MFGQNNNTQNTNTGGGLFGSSNTGNTTGGIGSGTNTSGGLFGKPTSTFGGQSGGGLFGLNNNTQQNNTTGTSGGLFGGSSVLGGQQQQQQNQTQNQGQQSLVNIGTQNPYGNNKLFQSIQGPVQSSASQPEVPKAIAVNPPAKKHVSLLAAHKVAPLFAPGKRIANSTPKKESVVTVDTVRNERNKDLFDADVDAAIMSSEIFAPKTNYRKLVLNGTKNNSNGLLTYTDTMTRTHQVSFTVDNEKENIENGDAKPKAIEHEDVDDDGYYTLPSLSELKKKPLGELRAVKDFTVGRKHYGKVKFLEPVDLSAFNLDEICGNLITFGPKNVVIYPEDDEKPKEGEGFNIPAQVTLEGCYPINKKTKLSILDPKDEIVKKHIEKLKALPDMIFKDYEPTTGNWTFTFEHV